MTWYMWYCISLPRRISSVHYYINLLVPIVYVFFPISPQAHTAADLYVALSLRTGIAGALPGNHVWTHEAGFEVATCICSWCLHSISPLTVTQEPPTPALLSNQSRPPITGTCQGKTICQQCGGGCIYSFYVSHQIAHPWRYFDFFIGIVYYKNKHYPFLQLY